MEAVSSIGKLVGAKNIFKTPTPPEAQAPATPASPAVQQKVAQSAASRRRARGYRSTILSQQFMAPDAAALKETIGS